MTIRCVLPSDLDDKLFERFDLTAPERDEDEHLCNCGCGEMATCYYEPAGLWLCDEGAKRMALIDQTTEED